MLFLNEVLSEEGTRCSVSTGLDLKKIEMRVEDEGLSFLTITLPTFAKDFVKSLDAECVDRQSFKGFAFKGGLPLFLGGFLDLIFDRSNGRLLKSPSIPAIRAVLQVCNMYSKVNLPCSNAREVAAMRDYIQCEMDVRAADSARSTSQKEDFLRISKLLWAEFLSEVDTKVYHGGLLPKHGPGATADGLKGNLKFTQLEWTTRLEEYFPAGEMLIPNWGYTHILDRLTYHEPGAERPVKVTPVPKTLKAPRLIAIEPTCMQYAQQALKRELDESIERHDNPFNFVRYLDQTPNQRMAKLGSYGIGNLATLDLSEASDRVSTQHVELLLQNHPHLSRAVFACRSLKAEVPDHGVIHLAKFASMGSALTFPIEALVFTTVVFLGIESQLSRHLTRKDIKSFFGKVRVYGDDIIVPADFAVSVVRCLELFGFKVNRNKSFWTGRYRESCGKEYFDGYDVSQTRVRQVFPTQLKHTREIVATVALRNLLWEKDYFSTVAYLDRMIKGFIPFPYVEPTSPALGRFRLEGHQTDRWDPSLHRPLVKAAVLKPRKRRSKIDDYAALMKIFTRDSELPFEDVNHLEYAGRPVSVDIKTRYVPAL